MIAADAAQDRAPFKHRFGPAGPRNFKSACHRVAPSFAVLMVLNCEISEGNATFTATFFHVMARADPMEVDMAYQNSTHFNPTLNRPRAHWQDWLNVLLAIWLFVSPWALNFGGVIDGGTNTAEMTATATTAAWNARVLGVIVFLLSLSAVRWYRSSPEWFNMLLGIWIFIAPWILRFVRIPEASWNHWIVGALIVILATWSMSSTTMATGVPAE